MIYFYNFAEKTADKKGTDVQKYIEKTFYGKFAFGTIKIDDVIERIEQYVKEKNEAYPNSTPLFIQVHKDFSVPSGRWLITVNYREGDAGQRQELCCALFAAVADKKNLLTFDNMPQVHF